MWCLFSIKTFSYKTTAASCCTVCVLPGWVPMYTSSSSIKNNIAVLFKNELKSVSTHHFHTLIIKQVLLLREYYSAWVANKVIGGQIALSFSTAPVLLKNCSVVVVTRYFTKSLLAANAKVTEDDHQAPTEYFKGIWFGQPVVVMHHFLCMCHWFFFIAAFHWQASPMAFIL